VARDEGARSGVRVETCLGRLRLSAVFVVVVVVVLVLVIDLLRMAGSPVSTTMTTTVRLSPH